MLPLDQKPLEVTIAPHGGSVGGSTPADAVALDGDAPEEPIAALNGSTPEESVAALVDAVKRAPERRRALVALLSERHPLYAGRSTNATTRLRGYTLAAFESTGLPPEALPYVLEELESGRDPYLVAAAAKALRGLPHPTADVLPFLLRAIENVRYTDDAVTFAAYRPRWPAPDHTTALAETFRTFAWLGALARPALPILQALSERPDTLPPPTSAALTDALAEPPPPSAGPPPPPEIATLSSDASSPPSCCAALDSATTSLASPADPPTTRAPVASPSSHPPGHRPPPSTTTITFEDQSPSSSTSEEQPPPPFSVAFEDQDGRSLTYGTFFVQRPSIVVFFYSRCTNPSKCSSTITKLGQLQAAIRATGLEHHLATAAITYDPDYDLPPRMRAYGAHRGVTFDDPNRFLRTRTRSDFQTLQRFFRLEVNFSHALVNRHAIELFILDGEGRIAATFSRLQWDVQDVLRRARTVLPQQT